MPVQVLCPNPKCQKALSLGDDLAGRGVRCPHCGTSFRAAGSTHRSSASTIAPPGAPPAAPAAAPEAPPLIGPYAVRAKLGEGAFGMVYKGFDEKLGRDVAIKVLKPSALGSAKYIERFLREAKVVAQMLHGNIVPVYQLGEHGSGYFIASAFIPGEPLSQVIPENGLDPARAVRLVVQLLEALAYAHDRGVLHRDVKPSNAMLDAKDTLYLMDFGLAGLVGENEGRMTQDGTVMGTAAYMPPEQARGAIQLVGPASDQYSAGVVLYELLTGHLPFEGGPVQALIYNAINTPPPPPSEWRPDLDPWLERLCLRALAKDPAARFGSCRQFADALRDWLAGRGKAASGAVVEVIPADEGLIPEAILAGGGGARAVAAPGQAKTRPTVGKETAPRPAPAKPGTGGRGNQAVRGTVRVAKPITADVPAARQTTAVPPAAPARSRVGWLILALALTLLPVLAAGGYVAFQFSQGGGKATTEPAKTRPGLRDLMDK